jgi:hypothetical protein
VYFISCKILGVEPGSDVETIKTAFRKLAKELHPDMNPSEKAHQYFIVAQNAYQYLLDHPYNKFEAELLLKQKNQVKFKPKVNFDQAIRYRPNPMSSKTLREILKSSLVARVIYSVFHVLFITVGIYLIYRPIYDFIFVPVDTRLTSYWAYFVLVFGFLFGLLITSIFLFTGIKFMRDR